MSEERTPPQRIRISGLREDHMEDVAKVESAATALYYEIGFDGAEVPTRSIADIVSLTRHHNVRVAEADHVVAGYAAWRDESPGVAYVEEISVHPDFQRFGVGSKLMGTIQEEAREAGLKHVVARCWTRATWAMAFYKKLGFVLLDDAAPSKVLAYREERVSSGRPFTRPGEVALWAPIAAPPAEVDEPDEPATDDNTDEST